MSEKVRLSKQELRNMEKYYKSLARIEKLNNEGDIVLKEPAENDEYTKTVGVGK